MGLISKLQKLFDTPEKASNRAWFSYYERNGYGPPVEEILDEFERQELYRQLTIHMFKEGTISKERLEKGAKKMAQQLIEFLHENELTLEEYLDITG